jgi:hypothetical protein
LRIFCFVNLEGSWPPHFIVQIGLNISYYIYNIMSQKLTTPTSESANRGIVKFTKMLPVIDRLSVLIEIAEETGKVRLCRQLARKKAEVMLDELKNPRWAASNYLHDNYYDVARVAEKHGFNDIERIAGVQVLALASMGYPLGPSSPRYASERFSKFQIPAEEVSEAKRAIERLQKEQSAGTPREFKELKIIPLWTAQDKIEYERKELSKRMTELDQFRQGKKYDIYQDDVRREYLEIMSKAEELGMGSEARVAAIEAVGLAYVSFSYRGVDIARRFLKDFADPHVSKYGISSEEVKQAVSRNISRILYQDSPSRIAALAECSVDESENIQQIRTLYELAGFQGKDETTPMAMDVIARSVSEGRYSNAMRALELVSPEQVEEVTKFLQRAITISHSIGNHGRICGELVVPIQDMDKEIVYES